ncbi:MAG TPA: hypothetical protein VMY34_07970 [Acidimicrobiales bacterium]|nr:hypothetical protein [Acidimicrobiales bacterium]
MTESLQVPMAVAAALVGLAFAMATFERWLARGRRHELAWSISLAMFSLAAAAMAAGAGLGWSEPTFKAFYLFGAILNVPFLALGTVYLLGGPRRGDPWAVSICLFAAFAAGILVAAPITSAIPRDELVAGKDVFNALPRVLAAVASGVGAAIVFGGAIWSAIRARRARFVVSNALIAGGTAILSTSGLLNSIFDEMTGFSVTLVLGISVLFAGFLVATSAPRPAAAIGAGEISAARDAAACRQVPLESRRRA